MRCYKVTVEVDDEVYATRYAGTNALARETRDELMEQFEVKKSQVKIEDAEIPVAKDALLEFVNELCAQMDAVDSEDEDEDEDEGEDE